jgi:hypothetical protein
VKFCVKLDHIRIYKFCFKHFLCVDSCRHGKNAEFVTNLLSEFTSQN